MAYLQPGIIVPTEYWYEKPEGTYHRSQSSDGQLEVTKNQESWKYKWFEQHQEFELTINNSSASQWITVDHEDYEYIYNMYFNGSKMYEEAIENATLTEVIQ
ncbi:hypothetical protein JCM19236_5849 [Vibrio sp. JCM 19236]|nr:hypothetical protein JCM19236_5849 [Vibrio sp. JCM 19236]